MRQLRASLTEDDENDDNGINNSKNGKTATATLDLMCYFLFTNNTTDGEIIASFRCACKIEQY